MSFKMRLLGAVCGLSLISSGEPNNCLGGVLKPLVRLHPVDDGSESQQGGEVQREFIATHGKARPAL
ncbi:MAG: hypothetical protein Q8M07_00825, partial [Prosthecobacter sp.]|nr:hypothetical protein [Prosthecobacter sp.]